MNLKRKKDKIASSEINDQAVRVKEAVMYQNSVMLHLLPLFSMLTAVLLGIIMKRSLIDITKSGVLTLILTMVLTFYIRWNGERLPLRKYGINLITGGYLLSLLLILVIERPEVFSIWMLGGLLVAMMIDSRLGLMIFFNLSFIMGLTFMLDPETVIQLLIIGSLMSLLSGALKQKATMVYAAIIIMATNITLSFVIHNFVFETSFNYNYMNSLFSILAVLILAFLLNLLLERIMIPLNAHVVLSSLQLNQETDTDCNLEVRDSAQVQRQLGTRTSYEVLCDTNNELMKKLKAHSEALYQHSIKIGELSCLAAREIGANILLAKAGGYYHEIGKIYGNNYIDEGLKIAEEYIFPKELTDILKQHNIKYEKPSFVEAAIVMLSDNVVSTIEYIDKSEEHKFTNDKIIDNIFQLRMEKGTLDNSGLSVRDYKVLKEFYQKEFCKKDTSVNNKNHNEK